MKSTIEQIPLEDALRNPSHHYDWAVWRYYRQWLGRMEADDVRQIARMAILEAREKFDVRRGVKFRTYASALVCFRILDECDVTGRTGRVRSRGKSARAVCVGDREAVLQRDRRRSGVDRCFEVADAREAIETYMECLRPREREIVRRRFGVGQRWPETQCEIGRSLGVSEARISQILKKAMAKLRQAAKSKSNVRPVRDRRHGNERVSDATVPLAATARFRCCATDRCKRRGVLFWDSPDTGRRYVLCEYHARKFRLERAGKEGKDGLAAGKVTREATP